MNMGITKIFPILLTFYHQLVIREAIFETAASLIPYYPFFDYNDEVTLIDTYRD